MKYLLCLLPFIAQSQILTKNDLLIGGLQMVSGAATGVADQVNYHPNELFAQFPNLNRSFWDIRQSWQNNRWAAVKDANHTFKSITQLFDLGSVAVAVFENKKTVRRALIKVGFGYLCRKIGFHLIYSGVFKNKMSWH